jgi:hypothetical protein
MSDRKKLMALRDASVDARRKAALGLDMGDPSSLETLTRTHILIMALDAVIDELPGHGKPVPMHGRLAIKGIFDHHFYVIAARACAGHGVLESSEDYKVFGA